MKNISKKFVREFKNTRPKIGFLSADKIRRMFKLNNTSLVTNKKLFSVVPTTREEEQKSYELEAELRKATVRAYVNTTPLR